MDTVIIFWLRAIGMTPKPRRRVLEGISRLSEIRPTTTGSILNLPILALGAPFGLGYKLYPLRAILPGRTATQALSETGRPANPTTLAGLKMPSKCTDLKQ